jgi:hypothetical protein
MLTTDTLMENRNGLVAAPKRRWRPERPSARRQRE